MSLFQSSVIAKHLQSQNKESIAIKWEAFKNHFHNPKVQEEIKSLKEEQYQGEFLEDFFVKILGYTKPASSSETKFNLTTEYKNVKDSKKADGAIIINDVVKAVIELKGTNTTDLGKIEVQAFGYKNNQPECTYIITSNFEKLRFYIDNAIEHIEFNLFTLTEKEFNLLYLCLAYENIEKDIPKKIKDQSISQEDAITKKLYNDYSLFKRELHQNLVLLNPQFDALELFKKSQKLLDRFLFLFFAEDRQLLPPNSVRLILEKWESLNEFSDDYPLYGMFKNYFKALNTGRKGEKYDIFAYNGGLFKPDEILDTIKIDNKLLFKHTLNLSQYDFDSEVDVNILGHIFENSLNELDEIKAQLAGEIVDKSKTKRKKDGVFYTPKYITKYIVENTVGKLCEEKKNELQLIEDDYIIDKKRQKKAIKVLIDRLTEYRNWLLQLTICDPACGSGAFLNQALDFLINEHKYIDELQAKLFGDAMVLSDVEKSILENNLFGVDLNEESVEIAKLSLWLRTAQPNRKLNDLNNNLKCGNSLIDDPEIAGDKAFNWQQEFPQIFAKGGFDVVIGNPPYVSKTFSENEKKIFNEIYETAQYQLDLYVSFMEKGVNLLHQNGVISYIVPNSWLKNIMFDKCRKYLLDNILFYNIIPNLDNIFIDASVDTMIFVGLKSKIKNKETAIGKFSEKSYELKHFINQKNFYNNNNIVFDVEVSDLMRNIFIKINSQSINLDELADVTRGINPYDKYRGQSEEVIKNKLYHSDYKKDETFLPELRGKHVNRYYYQWDNLSYVSYGNWLAAPREPKYFLGKRILCRQVLGEKLNCAYIEEDFIIDQSVFIAKFEENQNLISPKFVLLQLTSKLISTYFRYSANEFDALFPKIKIGEFKMLPVRTINIEKEKPYLDKYELISKLINDFIDTQYKFQRTLQRKFEIDSLPKKLQDWYLLTYHEFIKELGKKKVKLSLTQEAEWEDYFLQESKKALALKTGIDATDKEIDQMVYGLYGLTAAEIEIVENA